MIVKNAWYMAGWEHELGDEPLARTLCGEAIVFFKHPETGEVSALQDRCCHRGVPLSLGRVVSEGLECGYHGMVFNGEGTCVHIPGQERIPAKARVKFYPVVVQDEIIWFWFGDPQLADPEKIVSYPFHNDYQNWPHRHQTYNIKSSYLLLVDNLMDLTHLPFVHRTTIGGGGSKSHVEAKTKVTPGEEGLHFIRWLNGTNVPPTYRAAVPQLGESIDRWMEFEYIAPGTVKQWTGGIDVGKGAMENRDQPGFSLRIFHGLTPETESTCFYFWSAANGYRQDDPAATDELFDQIHTAFQEDKRIVEAQQKCLDETGEDDLVDLASDVARVHMRRALQRVGVRTETL